MTPERALDREAGLVAVSELCAAFEGDLAYYKSADFDEASNRQRFIDPFFAALGWDVADEEKRGPYADVILEYRIREKAEIPGQLSLEEEEAEDERIEEAIEKGTVAGKVTVRRPDYSFRIADQRKFFVEAKRPSVEIHTPRPIFQVKSYAWNARLPLAILTDFEELAAFDCRYRPVLEEPNTGLLTEFKLGFGQYPENWDLLWETFSRDAVAGGSLTRYAEEIADRKGQLEVDKAFLGDLDRWRRALAGDLARRNAEIDVWQLNDATQLILDRLVFIRVCEDRRLEPEEILRPLLDEDDPYPAMVAAIAPVRENYNGGLLDPDLADELEVAPTVFKRIVQGLYAPWSPYRFDEIGVEILGSIYERALGSEITLDESRAVSVELKPEVRQAGGVYYTPQWVVDEIVRLVIDPLIKDKAPRQLREFRVLDPACGSGSFLLGAFGRLIQHFENYYTEHPKVDSRSHVEDEQGIRRLTTEAKSQLLTNSIFGVDVDPSAVEVTTMSLYLKSLESDSPEFLRTQMRLSGAVLPSLGENIRCGNSLVSTDYYSQKELGELDDYEEHKLRPFKWESKPEGFGEILEAGGFDAVIGNPPYFNVDATYGAGHPVPAYLKNAYPAVWQDKTDIYYFFLAKAVSLARHRLGFIVSRAFLEADKAQQLRGQLAENARLIELVDFDGFFVFADAGIATAVVALDTTTAHGESEVAVRRLDSATPSTADVIEGLRQAAAPFEVFGRTTTLDRRPWRFPNPFRGELFDRIDAAGESLERLCVLGQGMQTAANKVFEISDEEATAYDLPAEALKRRARNSDIDAFYIASDGPQILYLEDYASYDDLPEPVRAYLEVEEHRKALESRAAYKRGDCEWWRYTWPLHKALHDRARLVNPYRTGHNRFAVDEDFRWVTLTDTTVAFLRDRVNEDIRYLQGLLNTKLLTFRFRGLGKLTSPGMWEAFDNSIKAIPIRRIDVENGEDRERHDAVVRLVDELTAAIAREREGRSAADRSLGARKAEALQDDLDQLALDLYGISDAEERASVLALGAPLA